MVLYTNIHGLVYQYSWSYISIFMVVMSQLKPTSVRFTGLLISKASTLLQRSTTPIRYSVQSVKFLEGSVAELNIIKASCVTLFQQLNKGVASSPGHSQILSCSRGERSGEGLGSKLRKTTSQTRNGGLG